ncbi:MAG: hypothetical protein EXR69_02955 [Myxococcales bacterium]|nr:hypothetical protein [Myxococcales bacterium]
MAADERAPSSADAFAAPDEAAPRSGTPPGGADPTRSGVPVAGVPGAPMDVAPGVPGAVEPGVPGAVTPGAPGDPVPGVAVQATMGVATDPPKGIPVAPKPAPPGTPQPNSGPQVTIAGTVGFTTYKQGAIRITAFDGDHSRPSTTPPRVLGMAEIDRPGTFSLGVPQGAGKVYIEGSIDEDMDGRPGPQEPQGKADRYPLTVASAPISGVKVQLNRVAPPPDGGQKKDDF